MVQQRSRQESLADEAKRESNQKTKFFKKIVKDKLIPSIKRGEGTGASRNAITDKLKEMTPSLLEKIKSG